MAYPTKTLPLDDSGNVSGAATAITTLRAAAGTRYANAVTALHAAFVDLQALDVLTNNTNVGGNGMAVNTFTGGEAEWRLPLMLRHPVYIPNIPGNPNWAAESRARLDIYFSNLS
ncbi:hypothetical protein M446_6969 (plasmid) [Methylobacterium sp. 4-46]|uniref:hypothetical protein n=1 Tax=unclassified Methylobacterium TaxID=2615210 RepID=UPI000165CBF9|nr:MULTISPECIES: hypothetical protein [Methylobacterium]ACA21202.1 hypothetical protein M446_6969 [Methylobacterium sp. 4-46]WFT83772.1 hypothetical protein QA634_35450 [Methylobacterium nodulans]